MSEVKEEVVAPKKKKGKLIKILVLAVVVLVLVGGGVGAGLYAAKSGLVGGEHAEKEDPNKPKLVLKGEQKPAGGGESEGGEGGGESEGASASGGAPTPAGQGGDKYATTYVPLEKEFTSNLKESVHFVQVGIAVSTPYDQKVVDNLKTHEIAVRSAILMTLADTNEEDVFTTPGKQAMQKRLAAAINGVLKQKEGFGGISNVYFTNFVVQ